MEKENILDRRVEYIEELFEDNRKDKYMIRTEKKENLPITSVEVAKAIKSMQKKKAPGPDDITIEMVQALDDFGIEWLTALANKIYDEGHFQMKWVSQFLSRYLKNLELPNANYIELLASWVTHHMTINT